MFKEILPTTGAEREAFNFFKRYIRGIETLLLKKLLRLLLLPTQT